MITSKRVKVKGHYRIIERDEKGRIVSSKKWHNHKALKCELCGDPATTWNCFGDGPKRVCKGCNDSMNDYYGEKCDLACIPKKENKTE